MSEVETREHSRWAAVGAPSVSGWAGRLLIRLARRMEVGQLSLALPDGGRAVVDGRQGRELRAVLDVRDPAALLRRLLLKGATGFGEAYVDGHWDSPDLVRLLHLALANEAAVGAPVEGWGIARAVDRLRHFARANTRRGSRRNVADHYDLGNDFYALWLDSGMTYSSALFACADEPLEAAQDRKFRRLADALGLAPGHHVLEIGCGWGGFAIVAARDYGCRVTAITLSREQWRHARDRISAAGLADRVDIRLQDYRDVDGQFDRIASIEMFEAVGEAHWPTYFEILRRRLRPGGVAGLQIITIEDARFELYRRGVDFIQRYVFPGGMLPSPSALAREIERAGLRLVDSFTFGASYAETLAVWRERFRNAWPRIRDLGFDGRFKRLWEYYLAYCEAGFRSGAIDVAHFRIERA